MIKNKTKTNKTEDKIKLHFIVAAVLFLIATLGFSVFLIVAQIANSASTSEHIYYFASSFGLPLVTLIISYLILPKTYNKIDTAFWTVLLTFIGLLLFVSVNQLTFIFPVFQQAFYNDARFYIDQIIVMALSYIPTAIYFAYVYKLFHGKSRKTVTNKTKK